MVGEYLCGVMSQDFVILDLTAGSSATSVMIHEHIYHIPCVLCFYFCASLAQPYHLRGLLSIHVSLLSTRPNHSQQMPLENSDLRVSHGCAHLHASRNHA